MRSIIVPVNFSPCSRNAAHYAADLAKATGATLHLVHVIQLPMSGMEPVMNEYLFNEMADSAETGLINLLDDIRKRTGGWIRVQTYLKVGHIAAKVEELFDAINACLIVMGVTGPTMEKLLAGSPVGPLLHLRLPLLVVPEQSAFRPYRMISLACDESDIDQGVPHSLPLLLELRDCFGAAVEVVTVETAESLTDEACGYFTASASPLATLNPIRRRLRRHSIDSGLANYLEARAADLAVVFPKRYSLFDFHLSHSRRLARHADIPVLCLPE